MSAELAQYAIAVGLTPRRLESERAIGGQWKRSVCARSALSPEELKALVDRWLVNSRSEDWK